MRSTDTLNLVPKHIMILSRPSIHMSKLLIFLYPYILTVSYGAQKNRLILFSLGRGGVCASGRFFSLSQLDTCI